MEIGSKIKAIRLRRGLTQEELATRCELTKGYISQLENELASPSIATLQDILNVLGVTLPAFFAEEKEEQIVFGKADFFVSASGDGESTWLIPNSQKNEMEPIMLVLPEGGESETRAPFEGEEFGRKNTLGDHAQQFLRGRNGSQEEEKRNYRTEERMQGL